MLFVNIANESDTPVGVIIRRVTDGLWVGDPGPDGTLNLSPNPTTFPLLLLPRLGPTGHWECERRFLLPRSTFGESADLAIAAYLAPPYPDDWQDHPLANAYCRITDGPRLSEPARSDGLSALMAFGWID